MRKMVHAALGVLLLWVAGCSRPPIQVATTPVPDTLVREAAGKAAFFDFYSPT